MSHGLHSIAMRTTRRDKRHSCNTKKRMLIINATGLTAKHCFGLVLLAGWIRKAVVLYVTFNLNESKGGADPFTAKRFEVSNCMTQNGQLLLFVFFIQTAGQGNRMRIRKRPA